MADGPVRKLLFYEEKSILITVTTNQMLTQHSVSPEGDTREMLKVCFVHILYVQGCCYLCYPCVSCTI